MKKRIAFFFVACLLIAAAAVFLLQRSYAGFSQPVTVDIPRGSGTSSVARMLADSGVVQWSWQFLAVRALRPKAKLQAGEYRFENPATVFDVFERIARGDVVHYELVVPEGANTFDIAESVERLGFLTAQDFLRTAGSPELIRDLDPQAHSLEGYLFPATYQLTRHTSAARLAKDMTDRFRRTWKSLHAAPADAHRIVTLASLVEKETGTPAERPLVASVFVNRLEKGMRLECDPTTIYAALLENRYKGAIHRSDLASQSLYNTYQHEGLPPGPIANPGQASLEAALRPASTDYLFFVAKAGGGGHEFSSDLAGHNKAVAAYRRGQQKSRTP